MDGAKDKTTAKSATAAKRVVILSFPGANPIDVSAPSTVFATANRFRPNTYELVHASPEGGEIESETGLCFAATTALGALPGPVDTLLIAGGAEDALRRLTDQDQFLRTLRAVAGEARRTGSVCTGAFILASAGLLRGRRAVTHWAACSRLSEYFEDVRVSPDAVYVYEDGIFTSAGVTAAIDVSLALVEEDLGHRVAASVARSMVVFLRRPGGQSQFSETLSAQERAGPAFGELVAWIADHLGADLSVPALARRCSMSERTFQRRFRAESGRTPSEYVRSARVEAARRWLEATNWPLERVAQRAGFGSVDALERAFARTLACTPGSVRAGFGTPRARSGG